ncbi:hypothetical protein [Sphaerimonospora thailandensis]|uniref:hypothetical protein n=1 Tax=Sphaerimonospora thailandensis TaxID=795644 RepID=UPI00194F5BD4|nr:hypothetical protein [Sphaerimonospora thailandensis]
MTALFSRRRGRHVRHGSFTGWGCLARAVQGAAAHPVVDAAIARPVLGRKPYETPRSAG